MNEEFVPLGKQSPTTILQKLVEIGDDEAIEEYVSELVASQSDLKSVTGLESVRLRRNLTWLNTQHQYGYIPHAENGTKRFQQIISAGEAKADNNLKNQRINIRLDFLRVHRYPVPLISLGNNVHTILFTFEAQNQLAEKSEPVAFNRTFKAKSGQDAAIEGFPIFIGLTVGSNGLVFSCKTVNIGNSDDERLVDTIDSDAAKAGLSLLTTAQPALAPFVGIAKGLCTSLVEHRKNVGVQDFSLGLDFDTGAPGARLAIGSYLAVQVEGPGEINWNDWHYDRGIGTVMRKKLAKGEEPYPLHYNAIVFRISQYAGL